MGILEDALNIKDDEEEATAPTQQGKPQGVATTKPSGSLLDDALNLQDDQQEQKEETPDTTPSTFGEAIVTGTKNFPKSFMNLIEKSVDFLAESAASMQNAGTATILGPTEQLKKNKKIISGLWDELSSAYGSEDSLKNTIAQDPARVLSDVSAVLMGGGRLLAKGGATRLGGAAEAVGGAVDPLTLSLAPVKGVVKLATHLPLVKRIPLNLYSSALKPRVKDGLSDDVLDQTFKVSKSNLDKGRGVSLGVWERTKDRINLYKHDVKKIIDDGTKQGDVIDIQDLVSELDVLKTESAFKDVRPDLLEKAIDNTKKALIGYHMGKTGGKLTPRQTQGIKVQQWEDVSTSFGKLSTAYKESIQMALGQGAKKSLEKLYPELADVNAALGELLGFNGDLSRALNTHIIGDEMRSIAFVLKAIVDNPAAKSRVAIWLRRAQKNHPLGNPKALERNLLYQLGRVEAQEDTASEETQPDPELGGL